MKPSLPLKVSGRRVEHISKSSNFFERSLNRFIVTLVIFMLVLTKIERAACNEQPQSLNISGLGTTPILVSESCTPPQNSHQGLSTYCSGYTTIPTVNFSSQLQITELVMNKGNNLGILKDGQLARANLSSLRFLDLQNCQITEIQRGSFKGGTTLKQLHLDYNKIEILDPQVFNELVNLRSLYLGNNPIKRFQVGSVFPLLMSLSILDINSCQLSAIAENTFGRLIRLTRLYLDGNQLSTLSWKMFTKLGPLEHVKLANNTWVCDCHVKFVMDILSQLRIEFEADFECRRGPFHCPPQIEALSTIIRKSDEQMQLFGDISFKCTYSGYPPPRVKWFKDGNSIELWTDPTAMILSRNMTQEVVSRFDLDELKRNIWFKEVLLLRHVEASDSGNYSCLIENEGGQSEKSVLFKFNEVYGSYHPSHSGTKWCVWMWNPIFGILVVVLLTINVIFTRRILANRKQNVVKDIAELNYVHFQEPISQQQEPSGNDANQTNMPLL